MHMRVYLIKLNNPIIEIWYDIGVEVRKVKPKLKITRTSGSWKDSNWEIV